MSYLEALVLGIIQGLTEFLPVSSSGHLELGSAIFGVDSDKHLLFTVLVHGATALSTIIVFRNDILNLLKGTFNTRWNSEKEYVLMIIVSMIPVGIVGVLFEEEIEAFFGGRVLLVGSMLLITGLLLLFTHFKNPGEKNIRYVSAFLIGIAQTFAIMPGISRSGATIATALLLGIEKNRATRFSFLMVLIPILGASFLKLKNYIETPETDSIPALILLTGFLAAFISGYVACRWMINIVRKGKLIYFACYCFLIGLASIIFKLFII